MRDRTQTEWRPVAADESTATRPELAGPQDAEGRHGYHIEIFLVSFAALLLEVAYTRVVSFKLFYYYTYLVIGLALMGIGAGGVVVSISGHLRRAATEVIMLWGLLLGAASVAVGYLLVAKTPIASFDIWDYGTWRSVDNLGRLLFICLELFASFIAVGVMLATLFGRRPEQIGRLYFADLVGAGLACAVVVYLLDSIGPPATVALAGLILALAGLRIALRRRSWTLPIAAVLSMVLAAAVVAPSLLPDPKTERYKPSLAAADLFSEWSAIFRVDVVDAGDLRVLHHDGLIGSAIYRFNGDVSTLTRFDDDPRSLPFAVLGQPPENVMIIGAAGGNEILTSLYRDAGHVDAIELNPVTHSLLSDRFADYAGRIADNPKVDYVHGDGRSFLARSDDKYDLVWYPAPDSYSATNAATAGAFVLSESYLYTSETIQESLAHLGPNGLIATQYGEFNYDTKPNRTARYISTARHALAERGIDDPTGHILVAKSPTDVGGHLSTILVKATPFTPAEIDRFAGQVGSIENGKLEYAPGRPHPDTPVSRAAGLPSNELDALYRSYPYDVGAITDDQPFFWHFAQYDDVLANFGDPIDLTDVEDSTGERVLLLLLGVAVLFAAVFLLLPFVAIRNIWAVLPRKGRSALYFASIGLGFMFFEITLIQRLTLFLGYPTYSLTVTLASILIFTGVGALLSGRHEHRPRLVLPLLMGAIVALTLLYQFALPELTEALLGAPLAARWLVAFVVLAPLGICLGAFMPLGLGAVARLTPFSREYVAWGWAVNGFASVVGAVLTTILAMSFGFRVVLFLALAAYLVAMITLRSLLPATVRRRA